MEKKYIEELSNGQYGKYIIGEKMRDHTTFKIGGPVDILMLPENKDELQKIVVYAHENQLPLMVIGNGSNLLVKDGGIRGIVIKFGKNFDKIIIEENKITAQAGALLSTVSKKSFKKSLSGMEAVSGIPASIGGAMTMNAGAYGTEMKDIVENVECMRRNGDIIHVSNEDMHFRYRESKVTDENLIVLSATFSLEFGDFKDIESKFKEYDYRRTSKQPLDRYSAGSTFKRPEGYYASKLIDDAGLRGFEYKNAQVSEKHCGFIINKEQASFTEVDQLIKQVQATVYQKYGVKLETEVKIVGE